MQTFREPARTLPVHTYDVVVAGGGTGGLVAALAAARQGARTILIESKGYVGGLVVEGGTALHSFYNLWKAFPGVEKKQLVKGIPQEIIDRLAREGATTGHAPMISGYDYDSVCTAVDVELYKLVGFEMLEEAGVTICVNTHLVDAITDGPRVRGVIAESRSGREAIMAGAFIDCTGYGDLCAYAGAGYDEPNDHQVANSIGIGGVSVEQYREWLSEHGSLGEEARGMRSGEHDRIVRRSGSLDKLPEAFAAEARAIGMATVTTTVHDDYFMFVKLNYRMPVSPVNRDESVKAEIELRKRHRRAVALFRRFVPGCGKAFIARSSPSLCVRRGRRIVCDYDISLQDVIQGRRFEDQVMLYGFHDRAPRIKIREGGAYGVPYRALLPAGIENLFATGMMLTSDWDAHMSTRNTVCCMGQGQAAGVAAALCVQQGCGSRGVECAQLRHALEQQNVVLDD